MNRRVEVSVRAFEAGDEHALLAAYNRAFARADANFVARGIEHWRWRFERNPGGAQVMLAFDEGGAVVAQYAALGADMQFEGQPLPACQVVDSFVDTERRALGREGLFVRTGRAFAERFCGDESDRSVLVWGLPVAAARRIGAESLGSGFVRSLLQLVGEPARLELPRAAGVEVSEPAHFDAEFDGLFESLAGGLGLVARRDSERLEWRYCERPGGAYRLAAARAGGRLVGYAVLARGTFAGREAHLLVDLLAERDGRTLPALVAWAAEVARESDPALPLVTLVPDSSPEWLALQDMGLRVEATPYRLMARSFRRGLDVADLRGSFWLTLGDTDLA